MLLYLSLRSRHDLIVFLYLVSLLPLLYLCFTLFRGVSSKRYSKFFTWPPVSSRRLQPLKSMFLVKIINITGHIQFSDCVIELVVGTHF